MLFKSSAEDKDAIGKDPATKSKSSPDLAITPTSSISHKTSGWQKELLLRRRQ